LITPDGCEYARSVKSVNRGEAKAQLSRLVRDIRLGREPEIVISLDGGLAARLVPYTAAPKRQLGLDAGRIVIADDFDDVDEAIADLFLGGKVERT